MHVIGLVGGIASGKSAVAAELQSLGAKVLDADAAAHRAIEIPEVKQHLVERWDASILTPSGEVDRRVVAKWVFGTMGSQRQELRFLEQLLHPLIHADFQKQLSRWESDGLAVAVIDAPLLLEAGWRELCDSVLFVDASVEDRRSRAKARSWTAEDFARREQAQMPIEQKQGLATHVVSNEGTLADLATAVRDFWEAISATGGSH